MRDGAGIKERVSGCAAIPCTCGELFQGTIEGEACLVSCPIDIYSIGKVTGDRIEPYGTGKQKTARALDLFAARSGRQISVVVNNPLPVGRGYGTSTADIGAALFTANRAFNVNLTDVEAARMAVQIDPTDSTFFPGLTLLDHRAARFHQVLGDAPPARLFILDPGGWVDSEDYNARDLSIPLAKLAKDHQSAFDLLRQGIAAGDIETIGEASTLSAKCHQIILDNPLVEAALSLSKQLGAAGICRAHSGTIVGLILPVGQDEKSIADFISKRIPDHVTLRSVSLVGGGASYTSSVSLSDPAGIE